MTPTLFGSYQLLERIGSGGTAEVFRARKRHYPRVVAGVSSQLDRLVALKRIHPHLAEDRAFASMFVDEARIASALSHPNVAHVLDFGDVDGQMFIAFEHIHSRDLRAVCRRHRMRNQRIPIEQACYVLLEACQGLDYAHERVDPAGRKMNVVHRDISPQNLLLSFDGELKVIDFGIAKAASRTATTERGWIKGKMRYMSPEQMRGKPVDRRTDIFALGNVLFELVTGRPLFDTSETLEIVRLVKTAQVPRPSELNPDIPGEFDDVVLTALSERPEDRYQSAGEFYDALMAFVQRNGYFITRNRVADWMKNLYRVEYAAEKTRIAALWKAAAGDDSSDISARDAMQSPGREQMASSSSEQGRGEASRNRAVFDPEVRNETATGAKIPEERAAEANSRWRRVATIPGWTPSSSRYLFDNAAESVPTVVQTERRDDELESEATVELDREGLLGTGAETARAGRANPRAHAMPDRSPPRVRAADLADHVVQLSHARRPRLRLPLPPRPDESGEIRLGTLPPGGDSRTSGRTERVRLDTQPGTASDRMRSRSVTPPGGSSVSHCPPEGPAESEDAHYESIEADYAENTTEVPGGEPSCDTDVRWTNWPTLGMALMFLAAAGSALIF
ncbi:MAG: serine/threonine protein kinase [Proteobacteria bacterium]|nr:serine/threonine protein kinase [Pseudomonadota bacterium]